MQATFHQSPTSAIREEKHKEDLTPIIHEQWLKEPKTIELVYQRLPEVREYYLSIAETQALNGGNIEVIRIALIKAGMVKQLTESIKNNDYKHVSQ